MVGVGDNGASERADRGIFTIGGMARRTGLTVRTIRFYSDEGLLPPTDRTAAGYRLYDARSLATLELVRTLRELGFGLPDVAGALAGEASVTELARSHVEVLDQQIRLLTIRRAVLRAVAKRDSRLDEVELMSRLASMSDEERSRLIDEFWDEVTGGLNINPEFAERMRSAKPTLPDDPTPEQLDAWIELAELVQDKDFRSRIRAMSESHSVARDSGQTMAAPDAAASERWSAATTAAGAALAEGHAPDSERGRAVAAAMAAGAASAAGESDGPRFRDRLADQLAVGTDRRAERYWQLMATINGWPAVPTQVPAVEWLIAALRAHS